MAGKRRNREPTLFSHAARRPPPLPPRTRAPVSAAPDAHAGVGRDCEPEDPRRALAAHLNDDLELDLPRRKAVVAEVATGPADGVMAELLLRICAAYGPFDTQSAPTSEVTLALDGLARLPTRKRLEAAGKLNSSARIGESRMPPKLRATAAAARRPDLEPLRACLADGDGALRVAACVIVGDIGERRLLPELRELEGAPDAEVVATARITRGLLGDDSVRPLLQDRLVAVARNNVGSASEISDLIAALEPIATAETAVFLRRALPHLHGETKTSAKELLSELASPPA